MNLNFAWILDNNHFHWNNVAWDGEIIYKTAGQPDATLYSSGSKLHVGFIS